MGFSTVAAIGRQVFIRVSVLLPTVYTSVEVVVSACLFSNVIKDSGLRRLSSLQILFKELPTSLLPEPTVTDRREIKGRECLRGYKREKYNLLKESF